MGIADTFLLRLFLRKKRKKKDYLSISYNNFITLQHNTKRWVHDLGAYIYIFPTSLILGKFCKFLVTCSFGMNSFSTEAETGPEI